MVKIRIYTINWGGGTIITILFEGGGGMSIVEYIHVYVYGVCLTVITDLLLNIVFIHRHGFAAL